MIAPINNDEPHIEPISMTLQALDGEVLVMFPGDLAYLTPEQAEDLAEALIEIVEFIRKEE